jgi:hypothetical protein
MDRRHPTSRPLAGPIIVVLLAGCAAGATPTQTPAPSSAPSLAVTTPGPTLAATAAPEPTPTPTPAPSPTAVTFGPVTVVTGTSDCPSFDFGIVTTDDKGVQHARGGTFACTQTVNDPRVSGASTATWNLDWWGTVDHKSGALVQWGTARLVNAGGAWEGRSTGVYSSDRGDIIATWYRGTGGYAGLAYFALESGTGPWTIQGQIFPGTPPTP